MCGFGDKGVWRYENAQGDPSSEHLTHLAKTLNVSTDYLLGLTEAPGGGYAGEVLTPLQEQWLLAYQTGDRDKVIELFTERVRELFRQALEQGLLALPGVENGE